MPMSFIKRYHKPSRATVMYGLIFISEVLVRPEYAR